MVVEMCDSKGCPAIDVNVCPVEVERYVSKRKSVFLTSTTNDRTKCCK
jgi:hypothetical protein